MKSKDYPDPKARDTERLEVDHPPEVNGQMLLDAGLNVWALHLLMESVAGLKMAPEQDTAELAFRFTHRGEHAEITLSFTRLDDGEKEG